MGSRFDDRVALVTGGATRLGRHLSLALAAADYDLAVHHHTSADAALALAEEVREMGRRCVVLKGDLSRPDTPAGIIDRVQTVYSRLDLLVNSASTFHAADLTDVGATEWDSVMDVNLRAPHLLVGAAAHLLRVDEGSVVNILDLSAFQPWTEYPHHAVSKAALAHLTRVQARALAPRVRVNAVAPGAVLPPDGYPPERLEALRVRTPLQRLGTPDDVAQAVLYLAEARYVTGQILAVDGGRLLGPSGPPTPDS
ncbi:MAG: SDR family oxidoreductase [Gemmatimonadota bacterium]|nr:SDR family oxidoreductase [Gemmatimonadota bacterium]MDH5760612.1 SDR family oxidoreductase [Gemmatimonadota bacterium]